MADQMKAKASQMYWDRACPTPSLSRLASEGVLFRNAFTPHPLCVPARTAVMASKFPHTLGTSLNNTLMPAGANHIFRIWNQAGYRGGIIGKNNCFDQKDDLDLLDVYCEIGSRGFPADSSTKGMQWVRPMECVEAAHAVRRNMPWQTPRISYAVTDYPLEDYGTGLVAAQTVRFLEQHGNEPFALSVSFPDPHEPYEAPRHYAEMFPPEHIELPPWRANEFDDRAPERNRVLHQMLGMETDPENEVRKMVGIYYAMVRFLDDGIGQILDALERLRLRDNTIVVFTADHGDFMGEHGMAVKGGVFYDCLVNVPLILSWPGHVTSGAVDESMVNTIDIVPTLLALQGLDVPRDMQGEGLPVVTSTAPRDTAFSEYGAGGPPFRASDLEKLPEPYGYQTVIQSLLWREAEGHRKMVRTQDFKYVHDPNGDSDELYDLVNDPWELTNVVGNPKYGRVIGDMKQRLANWSIATMGD
jgi:arylsulfatase A-like enzyme